MAENTPVSRLMLGNTTEELAAMRGKPKQLVIDTDKNTAVVMDGAIPGGHPLAKEERKIKAGSANVQINGGSEADLAADITITVLPGTVPTSIELKENPASDMQGLYLVINYIDTQGEVQSYAIDMGQLSDVYTAGNGITIENRTVSVNDAQLPKWGDVINGPLPDDYDASSLAIGATVAYKCDNPPSDAVYLYGNFNTKEYIIESGEWEAPVTGMYRITIIDGGAGPSYSNLSSAASRNVYGGHSGAKDIFYVRLEKGQKVDVVIGAGGIPSENGTYSAGGKSYFGELSVNLQKYFAGWNNSFYTSNFTINNCYAYGGGRGGGIPLGGAVDGRWYGAGGGAFVLADNSSEFGKGFQGLVVAEYYDPAKDTNISVDTATATTIADLQAQIAALAVRVEELENE